MNEELPTQETSLETAYETDYTIEDPAFFEPFVVVKPIGRAGFAWWNGIPGEGKVQKLIEAFKIDLTIQEACIWSGISMDQYKYFCKMHPSFSTVKHRCKGVLSIAAKRGLVVDISDPKGFRSRQWYLERKQPKLYGRPHEIPTMPEGTAQLGTIVQRAFTDKDGKVLVTETTASVIKKHEDS